MSAIEMKVDPYGLEVRVCRICLETRGDMIHISRGHFLNDLALLINRQVSLADGLPCWICSSCVLGLEQYRMMRNKAIRAQQRLIAMLHLYPEVNLTMIKCERERIFSSSLSISNTLVTDMSASKGQNEVFQFLPPQNDTTQSSSMVKAAFSLEQSYLPTESLVSLAPSGSDVFSVNPSNTKFFYFSYEDSIKSNNGELVPKMENSNINCVDDSTHDNANDETWFDDRYDQILNEESGDKDIVNICKVKTEQPEESDAYEDLPLDVFRRRDVKKKNMPKDRDSDKSVKKVKRKRDIADDGCEKECGSKKIKRSKEDKKRKKEKKLKIKAEDIRDSEIKQEVKEKPKGEFSSRMVLETEQYKVIKLTREEVLAEMLDAASGERYLNAPYKCSLCVKGFNYEDVLQNHMAKHEPKAGDLECDICSQFLPSVVSMRGHKKSHCTKYQCKQCLVVKASRQHLLEHYTLQHEGTPRTYICNVCGKTLTKRTMFQKHMRVHFPTHKIACDKCGKLFKTIETLRAHMLRHADVKRYACDQCSKAFRYASLLYTHKVTHVTTRDYYCVECDLRFKTQSNLRLHLRKSLKHIDPETLKFACTQCDKRYDDDRSLRRHISWQHLRQKNYTCACCDMRFGSPDGLRSHKKKIHEGLRPPRSHVCEICNHAFRAKAVLIKHIRVHTGERPFECSECGKKFAQNSTMATHIKLVHLKQARKPRTEIKPVVIM